MTSRNNRPASNGPSSSSPSPTQCTWKETTAPTSKCDVCNARNSRGGMRRCQKCQWQTCHRDCPTDQRCTHAYTRRNQCQHTCGSEKHQEVRRPSVNAQRQRDAVGTGIGIEAHGSPAVARGNGRGSSRRSSNRRSIAETTQSRVMVTRSRARARTDQTTDRHIRARCRRDERRQRDSQRQSNTSARHDSSAQTEEDSSTGAHSPRLDSVPNQSEDQRNIATSDDNNVLSQVEERPECPLSHPPPPSVTASDDNLALPIDQSPQAMYSDDIDERLDGAEHLVAYCVHAWAEYDAGQRGVLTPPNLHRYAFSVARAGREIWEQENGTNTDGCEDDQGPNGESQYDIRTEINAQGNGACRSG